MAAKLPGLVFRSPATNQRPGPSTRTGHSWIQAEGIDSRATSPSKSARHGRCAEAGFDSKLLASRKLVFDHPGVFGFEPLPFPLHLLTSALQAMDWECTFMGLNTQNSHIEDRVGLMKRDHKKRTNISPEPPPKKKTDQGEGRQTDGAMFFVFLVSGDILVMFFCFLFFFVFWFLGMY